ncbi:hypothetical protein LINPERPRIM_LOCUS1682 [Linum perenne]
MHPTNMMIVKCEKFRTSASDDPSFNIAEKLRSMKKRSDSESREPVIIRGSGVVPPSRCNYVCSKENSTAAAGSPGSASSPRASSSTTQLQSRFNIRVIVLMSSLLLLLFGSI